MRRPNVSVKQMIAYKIGARARKFASEGCPIEGYDLLYGAIAEARQTDSEMVGLLEAEIDRYERWVEGLDTADP
ncbi:MAG: hypothetical protein RMJ43_04420 [Chloroherpetonaceae bacterium]|nr:hypothetical protein [Chthonomonadaceae bacterium]MDW8207058.1 hypothetical protein [Chloroherpetonaceae bacterium]